MHPQGSPHPSPSSSLLLSPPPPPAAPPTTPFPPTPSALLPSPPLLAPPPFAHSTSRPKLKRPLTGLEAITEATSPDERLGRSQADEAWAQGLAEGLEREGVKRRRRKEPDYEAFGKLSLVNPLSPSSNPSITSLSTLPPSLDIPQQQQFPTLAVPSLSSSAGAEPTTPPLQQDPSHLSASFPPPPVGNTEPTPSPQSLGFAPLAPAEGGGFGLGLKLGGSEEDEGMGVDAQMDEMDQEEQGDEEMRPARGSYDLSPHRIYIASLSDDEDDSPAPPPPAPSPSGGAALELHPTLLAQSRSSAFPPSPLPPSLLASQSGAGSLILYRPLLFPSTPTSPPPTAADLEKERRRQKRAEELEEFRREQEREEARTDGMGEEQVGEVERGVEGMDLDG